jgi:hypothetical protein
MVSSRDLGVVNTVADIDGRATSWRRMTVTLMMMGLNGLNNRPWWGAEREKLGVPHFTLVIASKRNVAKMLRSILGVLLRSILRTWRLWARTKNEYTMDDFTMLTIREPWLLEDNFYFYRFHLASRERNRCHKVVEIHGTWPICQRFPINHYRKRKANDRVPPAPVRKMTSSGNFKE